MAEVIFGSIEFDYSRAISQANRLDEIAQRVRNSSASQLENAMSELRAGWEGETAESYILKGMELSEKIEKVAKDLENAADTIRRIARRIRDAERAAAAIASSLSN
ncbi:MAG: WXG100 family type VII secretion target [Clostridia bacterium]|nr:WXG100 family type VII secretion target [Clostridia bacterium]